MCAHSYAGVFRAGRIWFPRTPKDLDRFRENTLEMGEELSADHPGASVRDSELLLRACAALTSSPA